MWYDVPMSKTVLSVKPFAAGEVTLTCPDPGEWSVRLVAESGDVDIVRFVLDAPDEAFPPPLELDFSVPQGDIRNIWNPFAYGGRLVPFWQWDGCFRTSISFGLPLMALLGQGDESLLVVACSEASRVVDTRPGLVEETGCVRVRTQFFQTPEAPIRHYEAELRLDARRRYFGDAVSEAAEWLSSRPGYRPCTPPPAAFEPLYSTWYAYHPDAHASEIEAERAEAVKDGMRVAILDDGWLLDQAGPTSYGHCGDWTVSRRRFPDGMAAHVARIHALGMKYMVWFSVPFMGYRSANYEHFRGKFLSDAPNIAASVLDPRFREVREFLAGVYEKALLEWDIDGFKFDFIDRLRFDGEDPAAKENFAGRDIRSLPEAVDRLLEDVTRRLRAIKPDLLVEFRQHYVGPAIRKYGNMLRAADCPADILSNRVRIANLRLTSGGSAVHADMLMWHPGATPEAAALQILAVLFGVVQYSMVLRDLPPAHRTMLRHWIAFTKEHREALLLGAFRPHRPSEGYPILEGETSRETVCAVYSEGAVCEVTNPKPSVVVVNATPRPSLYLRLTDAPTAVEAFDTFGKQAAAPHLAPGVQEVLVPPSGYLRLVFR